MRQENLSFTQAKEAFEQLHSSSNEKRILELRMHILYGYNDAYGRYDDTEPSKEDYLYFEANCRELIKTESISKTLKAELYREIGEFNKCLSLLDSLSPTNGYEDVVRKQIRAQAQSGNQKVFQLK